MRPSYLVLRNETFHLRMRVPRPLVAFVGSTELRLSLFESRRRAAALKAGYLAHEARSFFASLHRHMKHLSRDEIVRMVADWKAQMVERDGLVRRRVETGLAGFSLADYGTANDIRGDQLRQLADDILPTSELDEPLQASGLRLANARMSAEAHATLAPSLSDPDADWIPLIAKEALGDLDDVSCRDLIQHWLPEAARLLYAKHSASANAGSTLTQYLPGHTSAAARPAPPAAKLDTTQSTETARSGLMVTPERPTLSEAWQRYVLKQGEREAAWKAGIPDSARLAWLDFEQLVGGARSLVEIRRDDLQRYEQFVNGRPRRKLAAYRGLSVQTIADADVPPADRLSKTGVTEEIQRIQTFFRWCANEHLIDRSPAEGLGAHLSDNKADPRAPWTAAEIRSLLDPDNLRAFMDTRGKKGRSISPQRYSYFPWLLVLGAYTGARLNELGGLLVSDFVQAHAESQGETPVILIQPNALRGLKTAQASRSIPVHPDLTALGLWDLIAHRRDDIGAHQALWTPPRKNDPAGKATDDFKDYTQMLGLYVPKVKVFHSFRHTFKTHCRGLMDDGALNSILGHAVSDSTGGVYEHALQTPQHLHLQQLSALNFGLDLPGLRDLLAECRSTEATGRSYAVRKTT